MPVDILIMGTVRPRLCNPRDHHIRKPVHELPVFLHLSAAMSARLHVTLSLPNGVRRKPRQLRPGRLQGRGHESVKLLVTKMSVEWTFQVRTLLRTLIRVREGICFWPYFFAIIEIRTDPKDLRSNPMLQPLNHASNTLGTEPDGGQGGDFFGTHPLPEVEPENHTVAFLVGPGRATLQVFIDLIQKDTESDFLVIPMHLSPRLRVDIAGGNVGLVTAG